MKVALFLTGFLRTYKQAFASIRNNILDKYDTDLYVATWNKEEQEAYIPSNFTDLYKDCNLKNVLVEDIDAYNKEKYFIKKINRINDIFDVDPRAKQHGEYWANRLKDQWFLVKRGFLSIDSNINYDIILRLRFDLFIESICLKKQQGITVPNDIGGWNFTDHMAYGDSQSMKKYSLLHDNIYELYLNNNIDITHAVEMPRYYLQDYKTPVKIYKDNSIKYYIGK